MYCGALEQLLVDNGFKTVAHMVETKVPAVPWCLEMHTLLNTRQ